MKTLMRAVGMLAGIAVVASASTASAATVQNTATAPRTSAIAWADCNYGLETLPTPALTAYLLTSDGIVMHTHAVSVDSENMQTESAVIGPKRFRAIAEAIDHAFFDPQPKADPTPRPTPVPGGLQPIGRTHTTDTRNARFAMRRGGQWTDWRIGDRDYTKLQHDAVWAAYAAAYDERLLWRPTAPRANAFAVCIPGAPRDLMAIPKSPSTSKQ
jgi:hypothetical protein